MRERNWKCAWHLQNCENFWNRNVLLSALDYFYSPGPNYGTQCKARVTTEKEVGRRPIGKITRTHTGRIFRRPSSCGDGRQIIMEWTRGGVRIPQWSERIGAQGAQRRVQAAQPETEVSKGTPQLSEGATELE